MRLSLLVLAGSLVLPACAFDPVQGSGSGASTSSSGGESSSSTAAEPTTSGGATCVPGVSIACTCPSGQQGAQSCSADGKAYGPCACEGGTDSQGGTTTGTTDPATTDPITTDPATTDPGTTTDTTTTTGPDTTTTGQLCTDPGPEPNNLESDAVELGDLVCNADAQTFTGVLDDNTDVDWFVYHGVYNDCGIIAGDPEATQVLTAGATIRMCVFAECDQGPVEFECEDGATMSLSPEGRPGCCNQGDVHFTLDCTDGGDESARIYIRLDQGPAGACVDYAVEYSYPT